MSTESAIRWVVALPSEARPIREHYGMQSAGVEGPFRFFRSGDGLHWLVVAGVGKERAAEATSSLHRMSAAPPGAAWINVGICGHGAASAGEAFLAHKVIDGATGKAQYPGLVYDLPCATTTVVTVDSTERTYSDPVAYDMEASAFFDVARRLTGVDLIAVLKVVSDSPSDSVDGVTRESVQGWMAAQLGVMDGLVEAFRELSMAEAIRLAEPRHFDAVLNRWRFTVSQQHALRRTLRRWDALKECSDPMEVLGECDDAKAVSSRLNAILDAEIVDWAAP